ncbi:MAG TPA: hypothetical protein PL158_13860, partial [Bacillota bacterium]|nr:hypothetical protein [Bacillota bacterium]HOL11072.1 hypothetical protein [Bacillota bacterium]
EPNLEKLKNCLDKWGHYNPEYWYKLNEAKQIDKGTLGVNFDKAWKNLAINDRQGFLKLQHNFIKHKYFDEAAKELKDKYGFDVSSKSIALQNVLWSTAVQHGVSGAVKIFRNAGLNLNEEQLIIAVYNERGKIVDYDEMRKIKKGTINIINGNDNKNYMKIAKKYQINGKVMRYFSGCSAEVQVGVYERFRKEKEDALKIYRENRGV